MINIFSYNLRMRAAGTKTLSLDIILTLGDAPEDYVAAIAAVLLLLRI